MRSLLVPQTVTRTRHNSRQIPENASIAVFAPEEQGSAGHSRSDSTPESVGDLVILCAGDLVRDAPTADHWLSGIEPAERRALPIVARVMLSAGMLFAAGGVNHAAGQSASSILDELEPVIVTGVRPGPALWKISSGDHTFD